MCRACECACAHACVPVCVFFVKAVNFVFVKLKQHIFTVLKFSQLNLRLEMCQGLEHGMQEPGKNWAISSKFLAIFERGNYV